MYWSRVQGIQLEYSTKTAGLLKNSKISDFWSRIHVSKPHRWVNIMKYYAGIMQDNNDLSNDRVTVSKRYINTILCILIITILPTLCLMILID